MNVQNEECKYSFFNARVWITSWIMQMHKLHVVQHCLCHALWLGVNHNRAQPGWESTHAVTSRGSDKLVVPEEKMADHEEQLSDEEKVRSHFNRRINSGGEH